MTLPAEQSKYHRTLDAKPNEDSLIKPGELVDVVEMSPLTLNDRRVFNLLLANAWDGIGEPRIHTIAKADLQFSEHKGSGRLESSIRNLMAAIVEVRLKRDKSWETRRVQLLGANTIPDNDAGTVHYEFPDELLQIVAQSTVFARLHKKIMFALSSKYALALYEMVQKRGNMTKTSEEFTVEELRGFLCVPEGKLSSWINLRNRAIDPAAREVSDLSEFEVTVEPVIGRTRKITHVKMSWRRKSIEELKGVARELSFSKVGRKERLAGEADSVASTFTPLRPLKTGTIRKAKALLPKEDIYAVEADWREQEPEADNPDAAFLMFCVLRATGAAPK